MRSAKKSQKRTYSRKRKNTQRHSRKRKNTQRRSRKRSTYRKRTHNQRRFKKGGDDSKPGMNTNDITESAEDNVEDYSLAREQQLTDVLTAIPYCDNYEALSKDIYKDENIRSARLCDIFEELKIKPAKLKKLSDYYDNLLHKNNGSLTKIQDKIRYAGFNVLIADITQMAKGYNRPNIHSKLQKIINQQPIDLQ